MLPPPLSSHVALPAIGHEAALPSFRHALTLHIQTRWPAEVADFVVGFDFRDKDKPFKGAVGPLAMYRCASATASSLCARHATTAPAWPAVSGACASPARACRPSSPAPCTPPEAAPSPPLAAAMPRALMTWRRGTPSTRTASPTACACPPRRHPRRCDATPCPAGFCQCDALPCGCISTPAAASRNSICHHLRAVPALATLLAPHLAAPPPSRRPALQRPPCPPNAGSVATCGDDGNCAMSCSGSLTISHVWEATWQCAVPTDAVNNPMDLTR